ncbi:MAG: xanthine dehydrogenase family protein subunit M [Deltaproteobacteria bacterium]|nr:xanthine dehydrogenase family protein subunit M [Deltaproteobacteria bacterium]
MLLPKFDFYEPTKLPEACEIMDDLKDKAHPLAGGTDLLVNMKKKLVAPGHLVSLARIEELKGIDASNGILKIGACVTAAELAESEVIRGLFGALEGGAASLGSPLIQNLATIGGNLVAARPAADLPPALMAYGAEVILKRSSSDRSVPVEDFFKGPGESILETDEILTQVLLKKPQPASGAAYIKLGVRKTLEISLVSVAVYIGLDSQDGSIQIARIVLGAVAPTPIRAPSAEKILLGEKPSGALFESAGNEAANNSRPIDNFRGSAEYRRDMVKVLTRRALSKAYHDAQEN